MDSRMVKDVVGMNQHLNEAEAEDEESSDATIFLWLCGRRRLSMAAVTDDCHRSSATVQRESRDRKHFHSR